jgi:hypothetical protein
MGNSKLIDFGMSENLLKTLQGLKKPINAEAEWLYEEFIIDWVKEDSVMVDFKKDGKLLERYILSNKEDFKNLYFRSNGRNMYEKTLEIVSSFISNHSIANQLSIFISNAYEDENL